MQASDDTTPKAAASGRVPPAVPEGYRQGLITAITVLLGFSLAFLRFWGLEADGEWTAGSAVSAGMEVVAIVLQLVALYRALRLEDNDRREYRITVRWFIASAAMLLLGLLLALFDSVLA